MQPTQTSDSTPFKGNAAQFVAGLKLEGVKDEPPTESEAALVQSWAEGHCDASARAALDDATGEIVLVEADKLDHVGRAATEVMGPLQTKAGVAFEWEGCVFKLMSAATGDLHAVVDEDGRPIIVWMHDECIYRHKDIGRHGWSFRKIMASQRFKDDGSGRVVSAFFSDLFGVLWVSDWTMGIVNQKRESKGKPPIQFGMMCPDPADPKSALDEGQLLVELQLLNAERVKMDLPAPPINANWACSAVRFDYGKIGRGAGRHFTCFSTWMSLWMSSRW
jgi:hypothetical protein